MVGMGEESGEEGNGGESDNWRGRGGGKADEEVPCEERIGGVAAEEKG